MPALLATCFTISGATSLVLQVVWARQLTDVFGSSSLAIATVLATFMGGLALGAHLGGHAADRLAAGERDGSRPPLLLGYALAEAIVGLAALAVPFLLGLYRDLAPELWRQLPDQPLLLAATRFTLTFAALIVPTTAMGATLPLLGRHLTRQPADLAAAGRRLGALYAANTAGALLGAAAAGFWLIPTLGVHATSRLAAATALALALAIAVFPRRRRSPNPLSPSPSSPSPSSPSPSPLSPSPSPLSPSPSPLSPSPSPLSPSPSPLSPSPLPILLTYAASGAIAMALEVFFSRALAILLGSSVYSFTLVLVVFLLGLSLGAAAAARPAARAARPDLLLAALMAALAVAVLLAHLLLDELPAVLLALLEGTDLSIGSILAIHLIVAGVLVLPVALGLGAVLPLVMRCLVGDLDRVGRDVGRAYAANTVGAIAGSLLAGFAALPLLGLEGGLRLCAALFALLALLLAWGAAPRRRPAAAAATAVLLAGAALGPGWNRSDLTIGLFRGHLLTDSIEHGGLVAREVVHYRDGVSTTVSVERSGESWVLKNNGKVEASDRHDMPTQILVGLLPVLLHPGERQQVFVVGYGSGVTVGAITQDRRVAGIDVAELEPAVLDAADRYFAEVSHHPAADRRVRRHLGDGRNVLIARDRTYDVIVSEPSNPWIAGVASLFTSDFYRLARSRLAPGGIFCQWAQLYELGPARVKMIYRTFRQAFPHVYAFTPGDETTDTILLGSDRPIAFDLAALDRRMAGWAPLAAELARADVAAPEDLVASLFLAPDELDAFTAGAAINTDDNALLEHTAPRDLLASVRGNHFARAVRGPTWPYGHLDRVVTGLGEAPAARELALARALLGYGKRREAATWLERAEAHGGDPAAVERGDLLMALSDAVNYVDPELVVTAGGGGPLPSPTPALFAARTEERARAGAAALAEGYRLVADGRWTAAWERLATLPPRAEGAAGQDVELFAAYVAYKAVTPMGRARQLLRRLYDDPAAVARRPLVSYYLGRASYGLGAFRDGVRALERLIDARPDLAREVVAARLPAR